MRLFSRLVCLWVLPGLCGLAATLALQAKGQESVHLVPADRVAVRQMSDVPAIDLAPGVHVRTVVGTTGSFSIGEFEPGSSAVLHHHTREQADIALTGTFDITLEDRVEKLDMGFGVVVPADVNHSIANKTSERATVIEFHTVRRLDLVLPRTEMTFPATGKAATLTTGRPLVYALDRPYRESPFSTNTMGGETCQLALRRLTRPLPVEISAGAVERFVYVIRGAIRMNAPEGTQQIGAGTLIVIPARTAITVQAFGPETGALAEFVPARR
jgi:mannose-6-phosphate isomerase-like protein (cupin superfamily)